MIVSRENYVVKNAVAPGHDSYKGSPSFLNRKDAKVFATDAK